MDQSQEIIRLLTEIRDTQRQHLAEYQKSAARSISLAETMAARQRRVLRLVVPLVIMVVAATVVVIFLSRLAH